jgi:lipid-binding SYLF domain-containing protein
VGRHATADTDWKLNTEILTYSRAKGAFAGLTLTGADVRRDDDSMNAFYGHDVSSHRVLLGEVETPAGAHRFINAVREAKAQARASN